MAFKIENDEYNNRHIIFSNVYDLGEIEVNYLGQLSNVPMIISFIASKGDVYNPILYNSRTKEKIMIDTKKLPDCEGKMLLGDIIQINTEMGNISAKLIRENNEINILDAITEDSKWLTLTGGKNYFNYDSKSSYDDPPPDDLIDTHLNLKVNIKAELLYEGV